MDKENNPYNYSASTLKALARFGSVNASSINPTSKPEPLPLPGTDHRQALGVLGLKRVSVAPEPITPLRGSSYTQPRTPATLPAIDWRYWRHMPEIRQWEACALSLNINPDNMKHHPQAWMAGPGCGPIFTDASFPSRAVQIEFDKRVRLLGASLFSSGYFTAVNNLVMGGRHLATVNPQEFAAWALHVEFDDMPPELVAMAETATTVLAVMPAQTAVTPAPVVAGVAEDEPATPNWKMQIQTEATALCLRLRKSGVNPTTNSIVDSMSKWCVNNGIMTDGGIHPSANYLRTHVLGGKYWNVPR